MPATVYANADRVELLLDRSAGPNARDKRDGTALMRSSEMVKLLLARARRLMQCRRSVFAPHTAVLPGFQHGTDQFISTAGSTWATSALLLSFW